MDISIVIPVYNSKNTIERSAAELKKALPLLGRESEILFCDDGSPDESRAVLEKLSGQSPDIRCFYNDKNYGLGFTLRKLFQAAQGRYIIYCDCDLPFGTEVLAGLAEEIQKYDVVVVSRYLGGKNQIPALRRGLSRCYYFLCKILFKISVHDIGSGTVAFKKSALAVLDLKADGFTIHIEWLKQAREKHLSVREIAAATREFIPGSFNIIKHGPRAVWDTIKLCFQ
ncbi:MAG: hypothetical protein A2787_09620 [Omnitrophica WOR_2 bacterium RIFCSPHIGHO2_01_FULL_48_9]|nr:MAG: hypothetical protein A3D10_07170 [Omnitrophica WOR_2 bacterium RIFCSPHIGHO2_02_FULL_48_11]OGX29998.1 MAG: hypothetical protein A2787_09620 [Omnitrophica WOR_2 bacterium RIFCSPHIGHO2_01_FULL_48_9]